MIRFHYLARGVYISNGKVLLARSKGEKYTFLPGGHIDPGEKAEEALIREIDEEIGKSIKIEKFIGAIEHIWTEGEHNNHEINLVFMISICEISSVQAPVSNEESLEFLWASIEELGELNLQPTPMRDLIGRVDLKTQSYWGSTI